MGFKSLFVGLMAEVCIGGF